LAYRKIGFETASRETPNIEGLFRKLFIYLHVDPGFTKFPDVSLHEIVNDLEKLGEVW